MVAPARQPSRWANKRRYAPTDCPSDVRLSSRRVSRFCRVVSHLTRLGTRSYIADSCHGHHRALHRPVACGEGASAPDASSPGSRDIHELGRISGDPVDSAEHQDQQPKDDATLLQLDTCNRDCVLSLRD